MNRPFIAALALLLSSSAALLLSSCGSEQKQAHQFQRVGSQGRVQMIAVDKGLSADDLKTVASKACPSSGWCKVMIWDSPDLAATRLPMTSAQLETQVADYTRNPSSGMNALTVGGIRYGEDGSYQYRSTASKAKTSARHCEGMADAYLGIRAEIQSMGLEGWLTEAADNDAYQAWQAEARRYGCIS